MKAVSSRIGFISFFVLRRHDDAFIAAVVTNTYRQHSNLSNRVQTISQTRQPVWVSTVMYCSTEVDEQRTCLEIIC